ncbi:MAG TPA: orotate phosphoribosyltransferase [Coriobacteriia bacterium]|nr:orotate phosphoribosyltransferase [Coriobacteriia bacterium]
MTEDEVKAALEAAGAILHGHFRLSSGRHSGTYVQCARILEDPRLTTRLAATAVRRLAGHRFDLVASPAVGGIIFGFAVAQALDLKFIFSERESGAMRFRRSFSVPEGARVLIVEDVVTTGGSAAEVAGLVREAGGEVGAVLSLIDRGGPTSFGDTHVSLLRLEVDSWDPSECVHCRAGEPLDSPGSRRL